MRPEDPRPPPTCSTAPGPRPARSIPRPKPSTPSGPRPRRGSPVRPAPLRFHDDRPTRPGQRLRAGAIVGLVLVQAAAVLMAVGLRPAEGKLDRVETPLDTYPIVRIDQDGNSLVEMHDDSAALGPQMAQFTMRDVFNQAESMATP